MALRKFVVGAANGNIDLVMSLLSKDTNGELLDSQVGDEGNTALMFACSNGREKVVRHFLIKGAKLEFFNNYGWTPLMAASYYGHYSIVALLLQNKCKPNHASRLGCTPLHCAARCNHVQVAELLIAKEIEVNMSEGKSLEYTKGSYHAPLMTAVQHGHDAMVSLLLSKGANVNYKDPATGYTSLMLAALNGHTTAVQILINSGANCNETNNIGQTALDIAKRMKRRDVENVLDQVTARHADDTGSLPIVRIDLVEAARQGNLEHIKELSKKDDFNVNETKDDGVTPVMCAAAGGYFEVSHFLIEHSADLNLRDKKRGWTALMYATNNAHKSIICFLILSGADVKLKAFDNYTAFDMATVMGDSEIIRILVAGSGISNSIPQQQFVKKMLDESLLRERRPIAVKHNSKEIQVVYTNDMNRPALKVLVSKGLNKLWNFNRTVRSLNRRPSSKPRSFQSSSNDELERRCQVNMESVKDLSILSRNITSADQLSTVMFESSVVDGIDQRKTTRLPLLGPSLNLLNGELSSPIVPPFMPTTTLDFNTKRRELSESLSTSPQVPAVFLNGSVYDQESLKAKPIQRKNNVIQDSDYYSVDSKTNGQVSPASNTLLNLQGGESPESSFSFSSVNSPNSSFTGSTNTRGIPSRKGPWLPVNNPSQYHQPTQLVPNSLASYSPPSMMSTSPTHHYLVPKTSKLTGKRKSNSLPRMSRGSIVPLHNPRGSVKSEPDDEEMKQLLAKLSLEKYTPILEEHEIDVDVFLTLNEVDLDEIGINQDDAKEQILSAVEQLKKQKERKHVFIQTEAWS